MLTPSQIDWQNDESYWLINPRARREDQELFQSLPLPDRPGHIWLLTSGSTSVDQMKWVGLSKKAILHSARAVNEHLQITSSDIWFNALPLFHIGGLSIYARAFLSGSSVMARERAPWNPEEFVREIADSRVTLASLVPTQVYDIVTQNLRSPAPLRAVVIGGGALEEALYQKARQLGWPLLPSYGLSECASQVATADLASLNRTSFPGLKPLSHVDLEINPERRLRLKSEALFEGYFEINRQSGESRFYDPKQNGWFETEDLAELNQGFLKILGRRHQVLKVSGELVSLKELQSLWHTTAPSLIANSVLTAVPCPRLGHRVVLVIESAVDFASVEQVLPLFQQRVRPFERVYEIYRVPELPRTELGKIREAQLLNNLGF